MRRLYLGSVRDLSAVELRKLYGKDVLVGGQAMEINYGSGFDGSAPYACMTEIYLQNSKPCTPGACAQCMHD